VLIIVSHVGAHLNLGLEASPNLICRLANVEHVCETVSRKKSHTHAPQSRESCQDTWPLPVSIC